jgi:glycosyltransferase involved in cell wall biosynthesis
MTKISIVVPAKNEEANIAPVLQDVSNTVRELSDYEVEIICVDDHSSDRTAEIARSCGARVIHNKRRSGKGMALRAGFGEATGDILIMLDADYSHRAEEIPRMLEALTDGVGLVIGSRVVGGSEEYTHIRGKGYRVVEVSSHERARAGGEIKSSVVRHGTRFLLRILWEGIKGVTPRPAEALKGLPAAVKSVDEVSAAR